MVGPSTASERSKDLAKDRRTDDDKAGDGRDGPGDAPGTRDEEALSDDCEGSDACEGLEGL